LLSSYVHSLEHNTLSCANNKHSPWAPSTTIFASNECMSQHRQLRQITLAFHLSSAIKCRLCQRLVVHPANILWCTSFKI